LAKIAAKKKLQVAHEFFADRAYNPDGRLASRRQRGAIIEDAHEVLQRTVAAVKEGTVEALDGKVLNLGTVHTICVHGDTPSAVKLTQTLRRGLTRAKVDVEPVSKFI
jgi:UPF0271 protein